MIRNSIQQYMAENLGMSQSGYGKLERGQNDISLSKLLRIAILLEVDVNDILKFNLEGVLLQEKIDQGIGDPLSKQNRVQIHQILLEIGQLKDQLNFLKSGEG